MPRSPSPRCEYTGCLKPHYARNLCRSHYLQDRRGQDLRPAGTRATDFRPKCEITFCTRPVMGSNRLCRSHYHVAYVHHVSHGRLIELLGHGCDACDAPGKVEVDHDHSCCDSAYSNCGKCVRGALCRRCNAILSYVENGVRITKARDALGDLFAYLDRHASNENA